MVSREMLETRKRIVALKQKFADPKLLTDPAKLDSIARKMLDDSAPKVERDVKRLSTHVGDMAAEWLLPPKSDDRTRLLFVHGGGYRWGSIKSHARLASDLARAANCVALIVEYRLAPEHKFPAAVDDVALALGWIRDHGPLNSLPAARTFIAGDSSGGGLALGAVLKLRDDGAPLPDAVVTFSAWTDMAGTGESAKTRAHLDLFTPVEGYQGDSGRPYLGAASAENPLASPVYGDFKGFPPVFMQVGDHEIILDDTLRVATKLREAGVTVICEVEPEAHHVFQYRHFGIGVPEGIAALKRVGQFLRKIPSRSQKAKRKWRWW